MSVIFKISKISRWKGPMFYLKRDKEGEFPRSQCLQSATGWSIWGTNGKYCFFNFHQFLMFFDQFFSNKNCQKWWCLGLKWLEIIKISKNNAFLLVALGFGLIFKISKISRSRWKRPYRFYLKRDKGGETLCLVDFRMDSIHSKDLYETFGNRPYVSLDTIMF